MTNRRPLMLSAALLMGYGLLPLALALDAPKTAPILTISGKIGVSNGDSKAALDMAMIEALPQHTFTTATPWFDKPVTFTGPLLSDLLIAVKAHGTVVHATAINDYKVTIPVSDASQYKVIVARLLDNKTITVREKGPLFVVYPFDSNPDLRSLTYYERSIWQLKALEIR